MGPHFMLLLPIYVLYSNVTYIYHVSCLVEIKLFQIVSIIYSIIIRIKVIIKQSPVDIAYHKLLYKWTAYGPLVSKCQRHNWHQHRTKRKKIHRFGDGNWVNSNNFIATTFWFSEIFNHPFSHVFIFANMFPESFGFVAVPITSWNNFVSFN